MAKIHTSDLVPIRPVAIDATRDIELVANPDIGLGIRGARQFVLGSQRTGHEQRKSDFPHIDVVSGTGS
jgi:hypothetical protein